MAKKIEKLSDLTPDSMNVNSGSQRGHELIDWGITNLGTGRSILADRAGNIVAGNKTYQVALEHDLPVHVVQSDGSALVVVQRIDLDLTGDGPERTAARNMAINDNVSNKHGYVEDAEMLLTHQSSGIDLSPMYREDEIQMLTGIVMAKQANGIAQDADPNAVWQGMPSFHQEDKMSFRQVIVHFECREDVEEFARRMEQTLTEKTKSIWFPYKPNESWKDNSVEDES